VLRPDLVDVTRDFEERGIAALSERSDQNLLARLRLLQRMRKHHQRM
jgi:hypothetical protein